MEAFRLAFSNCVKGAVKKVMECWKVFELMALELKAFGPAFINCLKEALKNTIEFWKVFEFMELVPGGIQASLQQLCEGYLKDAVPEIFE